MGVGERGARDVIRARWQSGTGWVFGSVQLCVWGSATRQTVCGCHRRELSEVKESAEGADRRHEAAKYTGGGKL